jgi:copper transport protein
MILGRSGTLYLMADTTIRLVGQQRGRRPSRRRSRRWAWRQACRWALPPATAVAALLVLGASPASAHAILEHSTPAADSVLHSPPRSVDLVFDEAITLLPDSVRVFGPDGDEVDDRHVAHAAGAAATASVGLESQLAEGTYLVSYRVVSADSHPVAGAYTFSLGHRSTPPVAAASGGSGSVDVALGLARWLSYGGSALGLGGLAFLAWCWPAGWASRRARTVVGSGVGVLVAGTLLALVLKGPYDAGLGLGHVTDGRLLREVLGTTYGRALDARLLLLAVAVLVVTYHHRLRSRVTAIAAGLLLAGVGVTFAFGGHAAAGGHRVLAIASDAAHVAAMSVWLGGLVLLGSVVLREREPAALASSAVHRFSGAAGWAVVCLTVTGTYQALREIRSWDVAFHSHYGHVLIVKLLIVLVALGAAVGSRAWVWESRFPTVDVHAATGAPPVTAVGQSPPVRRLRATVGIETAALAGVLVASALLVTSDPKLPAPMSAPVSTTVTTGPDTVRVSAVPDGEHGVRLRLQVRDGQGRAVEPKEVDAAFSLADQHVGPLPVTLSAAGRGVRTGHAVLPLSGHWRLAVTVRTTAIDEATAYVDVPVG